MQILKGYPRHVVLFQKWRTKRHLLDTFIILLITKDDKNNILKLNLIFILRLPA